MKYQEKTLPSGEMIVADYIKKMHKPYGVVCVAADGEEIRWDKFFATEPEAQVEYDRWN